MDCSLPGFSVHGILQARVPEWVDISFARRSSQPRDWTPGLPYCRQMLYRLSHLNWKFVSFDHLPPALLLHPSASGVTKSDLFEFALFFIFLRFYIYIGEFIHFVFFLWLSILNIVLSSSVCPVPSGRISSPLNIPLCIYATTLFIHSLVDN